MERREFIQQSGRLMAAGAIINHLATPALARTSPFTDSAAPHRNTIPDFSGALVYTTTVQKNGQPVRIHAISTGTVAVTRAFRRERGGDLLRKVNILIDSHFTEFMPVWVWVIEHPEGVIVVDTGENADVLNPDYFDQVGMLDRYINHKTIRFGITREQEIDRQLASLGIEPNRIRSVVMTHLHLDHTDGIRHFPKTEIVVARPEFLHPYNNLPELYPSWFKPRLVDYKTDSVDGFGKAVALTDAGDILLVATPGHTHHHSSVLFQADDAHYLFAGDTSYDQSQLLRGELAGVNANQKQTRQTYEVIQDYATRHPLVYLPSHDADAANRLVNRHVLLQPGISS